jgi:molybdate-binding protein/DNA-binding XRE family transcriptional regulator
MIMSTTPSLKNRVRDERIRRGWSQDELARRAGISRAGVSAIEMQRLAPSAVAALSLAAALGCRVEDLFRLDGGQSTAPQWAWSPAKEPCRFWTAAVGDRTLRYPVEATELGELEHDGVFENGKCRTTPSADPESTIVLACCDPAVGLLARVLNQQFGLRLLALPRSSRHALELLRGGLVHAAGVHLSKSNDRRGNAGVVTSTLGPGYGLLRVARWQEGLAVAPARHVRTTASALRAHLKWVGREPGSGARECLDELLHGRQPPRRVALDHRGVAEAIRCGWADAGVCVRLVSEEAGLDFIRVRDEAYDLCLPANFKRDRRLAALVEAVRLTKYRRLLGELPGYDSKDTGHWERVQ